MKITYLIGNGFDLHFGLKTRYCDFYNYYIKQDFEDKRIRPIKKKLLSNIELWSDLERALGTLTKYSSNHQEYKLFLHDIHSALALYLKTELQKNIDVCEETRKRKILDDMVHFERYFIDSMVRRRVHAYMPYAEQYEISFIVYNYTNTLERILQNNSILTKWFDRGRYGACYAARLSELIHIHGTVDEQMVFGVNDATQILNKDFVQNEEFLNEIVKPIMNKNSQTHRDEKAKRIINESDIICIYGMSIGDTDRTWWEAIGDHLATTDAKLIIFDIPAVAEPIRNFSLPQYEQKKRLFISKTALDNAKQIEIADRVFVCLSNELF